MAFDRQFLDELIARSDIVDVVSSYVQLTRKGSNLFGLCPFHSEKTGSFSVSPDKQIYYCFGCKKGGGVVNFIMDIENLPFPDAVRFLAKRAGMEVPEEEGDREAGRRRQRLLDLNRDAARFYYQLLQQPEGRAVQDYLDRRQIKKSTAVRLGMGASRAAWEELLPADAAFPVTGSSLNSQLSSVPACQSIIKKAVVKRLMAKHHTSVLPETGAETSSGQKPLSAFAALTAFQQMRHASSSVVSSITEVSLCYELQSTTAAPMALVPSWRIVTDTATFYVNCISGTVRRA